MLDASSLDARCALGLDLEDADVQMRCDFIADAHAVAHQIKQRQNLTETSRKTQL